MDATPPRKWDGVADIHSVVSAFIRVIRGSLGRRHAATAAGIIKPLITRIYADRGDGDGQFLRQVITS